MASISSRMIAIDIEEFRVGEMDVLSIFRDFEIILNNDGISGHLRKLISSELVNAVEGLPVGSVVPFSLRYPTASLTGQVEIKSVTFWNDEHRLLEKVEVEFVAPSYEIGRGA